VQTSKAALAFATMAEVMTGVRLDDAATGRLALHRRARAARAREGPTVSRRRRREGTGVIAREVRALDEGEAPWASRSW
jgi:hypothetical protein